MFKTWFISVLLGVLIFPSVSNAFIVDHTCADLRQVPQSAIVQAKASLHIAYGHTSHGSQLTDGMTGLVAFANSSGLGLSLPTNIFAWNNGGTNGALDLHDYAMLDDVGYYPQWVNQTTAYLNNPSNADVNVIIWAWCGQAAWYSEQQMIDQYLAPMTQLELTYPNVTFVYMTCHLNGSGESDNLNLRNQQIRNYCIANNKVLYDFADIESYDPDGLVNYMRLLCNDNCDYDSDGNGTLDKNWAIDWQNSHTVNVDWYNCTALHSQSLNGNRKAYAAWWLWARLGGWNPTPCANAPSNLQVSYNTMTYQVTLTWTDNSGDEEVFVLERSVDGGVFTVLSDTIAADAEVYADQNVASQHTYGYRIMARNANGDSGYSNTAIQNVSYATYTLNLQSTTDIDDSFLSASNPTTNYGSDAWATSNLDNNMRYIVKYNFPSSLGGKRILSADLNVYWWNQSGTWQSGLYMQLYPLTQNWDELSVTWNNAFTGTSLDPVLQFDGVDDYIEISDSRPYATYTISAYVTPRSAGAQNIITSTNAGGIASSHQLRINASGQFEHYLYDWVAANTVTGTTTVVPGTRYHVTGVAAQNGTMRLYVNGIEEGTAVNINTPWYGETRWWIGHATAPEAGNFAYFAGTIATVRIWDRALTAQEVLAGVEGDPGGVGPVGSWKLDEGAGTTANDSSGNEYDGTIYSATWDIPDTNIPWTTAGGVYSKLVGQVEIGSVDHAYYIPADVTDIVCRWIRGEVPNYGLIMINKNAFTSNIEASEFSIRSYLSVTYTDACSCDFSADFNYDCKVDLVDFYQMALNLGLEAEQYDIAPAGGDGVIDLLDLQEMANQWLYECM